MNLKLNTSYKAHAIIAALMSIWLVLFLVLIAPFDVADLPLKIRLLLMPFYGVISFASYMLLIPLQNWAFQKARKWTLAFEIGFICVFNIVALMGCFRYYQSEALNGDYPFAKFVLEVYYPIFFLLLTVLMVLRWLLFKKTAKESNTKIILKGENKLDALQIDFADLVCISSADNYVEVSYLSDNVLQKKLLRTTLKNIKEEQEKLLKVHRSHLINPAHFIAWQNANSIKLTQTEIPVSKTYKTSLLSLKSRP